MMKNFNWTTFTKKIAIKSEMSIMYDAWAKPSEIEKWFLSNADNFNKKNQKTTKNINIEKGFSYEWSWHLWDGVEKGKITKTNGKDFIQFTFAGECLVDIKLSQFNEYIIVELTQKNIPTDDESKQNVRLGCHTGWSFYMVNLKSVYEGGLDLRNKNLELKGMLNT